MATLAQLEDQIRKLQRRADVLRGKESVEVIAKIRAMMDEYGLTTADLAKAGAGAGSKNGAVRPKLPPKYRDPLSGATWSGHARPPAWIKDAPDRSVYLIDAVSRKNGATKRASRKSGRSTA
ncbi:histone family protein nucleoid-structuring protein H-NS [Caballeronia novacaledonica]|uniref:Histone family protein nucleoid-structuring protein H-NS n=1 Tax=Caballeronia novacaledonica TaxID=1544861 RepID=A0A2U3I1C7_9BURK|nr:H-NS histone family protein [Caballeronia novacaledonica]SPB13900.1 histone family protein nucleoid-structuring protein H-NS [Caballeronia novacaledonica]